MRSVNGFYAACGENVSIIFSSSGEKQLHRVLRAYVQYFNQARPHQSIKQQIPEQYGVAVLSVHDGGKILSFPILGGLHHDYREIRLISDLLTKKRMVPLGGARFIWEVAYSQSLFIVFLK
jgi:hypothetical protein